MQKYKDALETIHVGWQTTTMNLRSQLRALYADDGLTPVYAPPILNEKLAALRQNLEEATKETIAAIGRVEEGVKAEKDNAEIDPLLRLSQDERNEVDYKEPKIQRAVEGANLLETAKLLRLRHTPVERLLYIQETERKLAALPLDGDRRGYLDVREALDVLTAPDTKRRREREQAGNDLIALAGRLRIRVIAMKEDLLRIGEPSRAMRQF